MPSASADTMGYPGSRGHHAMTPEAGALEVCFGCGCPSCETEFVDWMEFLPTSSGPAPDPSVVTLCEGCAYAYEIGIEPDEFYMDEEDALHRTV